MRCPQCGHVMPAATQTRGIASAYCEECEQVWEWPASRRATLSGPSACWAARWTRPPARPAAFSGDSAGYGPALGRGLAWRGRLLRESEPAEAPPVTAVR